MRVAACFANCIIQAVSAFFTVKSNNEKLDIQRFMFKNHFYPQLKTASEYIITPFEALG